MNAPDEQPPDELVYFDGTWYLFKPRNLAPLVPPKTVSDDGYSAAARRMQRDLLWSWRIAPQPGPLCLVTGI